MASEPGGQAAAEEPRKRGVAKNVLRAALGGVVGLAIAEGAFWYRDGGAFPHLNLYDPDPQLGVRLRGGESMRLAFGGNPPTTVRVNRDGFRGADLPAPVGDEILVLGDSQVFGLGVEESETFSARLAEQIEDARVVNAGVPTYGPPELERLLEDQLARRKPKRVVYTINVANDLFEADRPNTERHAVWDGWAVRKETAPAEASSFPGREVLFRKSHAVFALRRWLYRQNAPQEAFSAPSEGTWDDIGGAAVRAAEDHVRAREETRKQIKAQKDRFAAVGGELKKAQEQFLALVDAEHLKADQMSISGLAGAGTVHWDPLKASFAQPGDIVGLEDWAEYSRPIYATVELILQGAKVRRQVEQILRDRVKASADAAKRIEPVLEGVDAAQKRAEAVRAEAPPRVRAWSPLAPRLRRAKELCDAAGARLFVAILPIDVQVSAEEWKKYGRPPVDLAPARILMDDLVAAADDLGVTSVDLTAALAAAEPGAFLNRDLHMTPKGHEAVAKALAPALASPPPPKLVAPNGNMPIGRTPPTALAAARSRNEVTVPGSTAAGCETYVVDEWLTLRCHNDGIDKAMPLGARVVEAPLGEWVVYRDFPKPGFYDRTSVVVQVPVLKGQSSIVDFRWPERSRRLDVTWKGSSVTIAFHELPAGAPAVPDVAEPRADVCSCEKKVSKSEACGRMPLADNPACFATYGDDCAAIVSCMQGDREYAPTCPKGEAAMGVFQRCRPLCNKEVPCKIGTCTNYEGGEVCL